MIVGISIAICVAVAVLATLAYGAFNISSGLYIKSLCRVRCCARDEIAITFDDGVDPQITPKVLDVLDRHEAKATFFLIGSKAAQEADLVREIARRGHSIGSHTLNHKGSFPMQSLDEMCGEIAACNEILERILCRKITLFRPPFGVTNPTIARAIRRLRLVSVGWSIRSLDTLGHPVERVVRRVVERLSRGEVILMHDNREGCDILLERILREVAQRRLRCVTIDELFKGELEER